MEQINPPDRFYLTSEAPAEDVPVIKHATGRPFWVTLRLGSHAVSAGQAP
jgi:hypothetical protein